MKAAELTLDCVAVVSICVVVSLTRPHNAATVSNVCFFS